MPAGNVNGSHNTGQQDGDTIKFDCPLDDAYAITRALQARF